jgi:hypothetical protein
MARHGARFLTLLAAATCCISLLSAAAHAQEYYLTVSSAYGTPSGEGSYPAGATAYAGLDVGIVAGPPGVRYVFAYWTGDASGDNYAQSNGITMNAPKEAIAVWRTEYLLSVASDHGATSGQGWYSEGTVAYAGVNAGIIPGEPETQYVFTQWSGDATGYDYASSDGITMNAPKTAFAIWKTQYMLTVTSDQGTPSGDGWKDAGTTAAAHLDAGSMPAGPGSQYVFTYWSGDASGTNYAASDDITMDGPKTAVANWKTQHMLTVTSDHGTPSGGGWKDAGTTATAHLDGGVVPGEEGIQYVFTEWGGDAFGSDYASSYDITMDGPKTAVASWKTQYMLTVTSDHGTPSGGGWKDAGTTAVAHLDAGVASWEEGIQYVFTQWSGNATGYDYASSDGITMNGPKTAIASWKTQYMLTVTSDHGTPSGDGWKDAGTTAVAHLDADSVPAGPGSQYVFTHWSGDATGTDYAASDPIFMSGPKTAVANWTLEETQYYLTVETAHGTPSGEGWYAAGSTPSAHLDVGAVAGATGVQYVFTGWGGDATGDDWSASDPILMDASKTAVANWKTQYMLTVTSDYGTPSGGGWKDDGSMAAAHLNCDTMYITPDTIYVFMEWTGDATGTDYAASDGITMNGPRTAVAVWEMRVITGAEPPVAYRLDQNYPNPFNPNTTILFALPEKSHVSLKIYDAGMRLVRSLVDDVMEPGRRAVTWDGRNNRGAAVASGVYFYRIEAKGFTRTRKMILLR